jgi:acyl-CoA dehydrogenase
MDFALTARQRDLLERTRRFVDEIAIPLESRLPVEPIAWNSLRADLQAEAREAGLFLPQLGPEWGGLGLDWRSYAIVLEEIGRSPLGPHALNCAAPDEGNLRLLERLATPAQRERFLEPVASGRTRSCLVVAEPYRSETIDPAAWAIRAEWRDGGWIINGRQPAVLGSDVADFAIVIAHIAEGAPSSTALAFAVEATNRGYCITRGRSADEALTPPGHAELELKDCAVEADGVVGEVGRDLETLRWWLGLARFSQSALRLGAARRASELAPGQARAPAELLAVRLVLWRTAWQLDRDEINPVEIGRATHFVFQATQ